MKFNILNLRENINAYQVEDFEISNYSSHSDINRYGGVVFFIL